MKQNGKTINSYFIFIILLLLVIFGLNLLNNRTDEYTKAEFIADLDAGNVSEVVVQPNGEAPTGYLEIQMKNGASHKLYATDITELETLVREYGFDPVVNDIERENWFLTYMLPMLVVLAVGIFLFMMMNAQQAGGGNGKMMNFGKSRAKMTLGDKSVTFAQVAGLKEEKEELEEIVDFLKEPGKYTGVGARIPKGVLLEGPPGTGKTLLTLAAGLTHTMEQRRFNEIIITRATISVGEDIGFLPEGAPMYADMTVKLFLRYMIELKLNLVETETQSKQQIRKIYDNEFARIIDLAKIRDIIQQKIETLSKGYLRRVGFAQSIIGNPPILLLDEPTDGLDPNQKEHMRRLIKDMGKDKTIIISTHLLDEAETLASRIILINKGRIAADGTLQDILKATKSDLLEKAFRKLTVAKETLA